MTNQWDIVSQNLVAQLVVCSILDTFLNRYKKFHFFNLKGPAKEIVTHDAHHGKSIDYIAKPDYQFEYGVEDPKSQVSQFRKENRNDDAVIGEYSYTDPLGHIRTVKYRADKINGFQAEIYVDGKLEQPHVSKTPKENDNHHDYHQPKNYESNDGLKDSEDEDESDYNSNEY